MNGDDGDEWAAGPGVRDVSAVEFRQIARWENSPISEGRADGFRETICEWAGVSPTPNRLWLLTQGFGAVLATGAVRPSFEVVFTSRLNTCWKHLLRWRDDPDANVVERVPCAVQTASPYTARPTTAPTVGLPTRVAHRYGVGDESGVEFTEPTRWFWTDTAYEGPGTWQRPISVTNERAITTAMSYDAFSGTDPDTGAGNHNTESVTVSEPGATSGDPRFDTITTMDFLGRVTNINDQNGRDTWTCYDGLDRLVGVWTNENDRLGAGACTVQLDTASQRFEYHHYETAAPEPYFEPRTSPVVRDEVPVSNWVITTSALHSTTSDPWHAGGAEDVYIDTVEVLDGMGRARETGQRSPGAADDNDGVSDDSTADWMVARTLFDNVGRVTAISDLRRQENNPAATPNIPWLAGRGTANPPTIEEKAEDWTWRDNFISHDGLGRVVRTELFTDRLPLSLNEREALRHQTTDYDGYTTTTNPVTATGATSTYAPTVVEVDVYGNTVRTTQGDATTLNGYNLRRELVAINDPLPTPAGADPDYAQTFIDRNEIGWQTAIDEPNAGYSTTTYYRTGETQTTTDAQQNEITNFIDDRGRTTSTRVGTTISDPPLAEISYDPTGNLGAVSVQSSYTVLDTGPLLTHEHTNNDFDDMGRLIDWTVQVPIDDPGTTTDDELSDPYTFSQTHTRTGATHTTTHPAMGSIAAETVTTGYTALGYRSTVRSAADRYIRSTGYDNIGRLTSEKVGTSSHFLYNIVRYRAGDGRLLGKGALIGGTTNAGRYIQAQGLNYDAPGNVTSIHHVYPDDPGQEERECFDYDTRQRLQRAYTTTHTADYVGDYNSPCPSSYNTTGPAPYDHDYAYDEASRFTNNVGRTGIDYDAPVTNPSSCLDGTRDYKSHAMESIDASIDEPAQDFTYDCNGSMLTSATTSDTTTYEWTERNRLETVTIGSANPTSSYYDSSGQRVVRNEPNNDRTVYFPTGTLVYDASAGIVNATRSYPGGGYRTLDGDLIFAATNHQGSIVATMNVADASYTIIKYDPYGNLRQGTGVNDHDFLNQIRDTTTNLNNRHYNPSTGVFVSVDPLVTMTGEPYIYGAANPVAFSDPDGLCASTGSNCPDGIPVVQNGKSDHRAWRWTILNEKFSKPRARELFALDKPDGPLPAWGLPGNPDGSRHAHYALTFEVSDSASPEQMADLFVSNCSEIFPVNNCTSGFEEGDRLSLEAEFGPYTQGAPVEVTDVGPTGVRFEALYGHLEGEGRQISFRFVEFRGVTYLKVEARGPGSLVTKVPIIADFNNAAAANLWSQLADNLRAAAR